MNNSMSKCVIIFSGYNQRAVITFLRTLAKSNLCYAVIAKSEKDSILSTEYKGSVVAIRNNVPLIVEEILEVLKLVKQKYKSNEYIIAPSTEALNRFILKNRICFESEGYTIPLVNNDLYELVSDKYSFGKLCSENKILVPKEFNFNKNITFPFVAKPKAYFSNSNAEVLNPVIIKNEDEKDLFLEKYKIEDFYFQEYVNGKSIYLLYYFSRNGKVLKFSQENYIQQPEGKSIVAAVSSNFHQSMESKKYEDLFRKLNFFGLVMVEVKQSNYKCYMIEANPRFWGPSQLFVDANVNFFDAFIYDYKLISIAPKFKEPSEVIKYFWYGGIVDILKKNKKLMYHQMNEIKLIEQLPEWLLSDIYRRSDSINIFKEEVFEGYGEN